MEPRQSGGHSLAAPSRRRRHEWWQASERHALKIHLLPSKRPQGFAPKHATAQECNARGLIVAFLLLAFDRQIDLVSPRAPPPTTGCYQIVPNSDASGGPILQPLRVTRH